MTYKQGEVIAPVLNLNGASGDQLLEAHQTALTALTAALDAINATAPHGRDFQTEDVSVYREASEQHRRRVKAIAEVYRDIEAIACAVHDQLMARRFAR